MLYSKGDYRKLKQIVNSMEGFTWLGNGYAKFCGKKIDLTATNEDKLAIGYATLYQISNKSR